MSHSKDSPTSQIRSDSLTTLRPLFENNPTCKALGQIFNMALIVDANIIIRDILWLTRKRKNLASRMEFFEVLLACTPPCSGNSAGVQPKRSSPGTENGIRTIAPARIRDHETAFAMTIHKSQESELARVMLILPDKPSRIVTRELLYTGITRTRKHLRIVASNAVLTQAITCATKRHSGLIDRLREMGDVATSHH